MSKNTNNLRISQLKPLITPDDLRKLYPATEQATATTEQSRIDAGNIIHGTDDRLLVILGPCSIHDSAAALEYGQKIRQAAKNYEDQLQIIMRVYFEKPRTTVGWKGLINDPGLDNSFDINLGLKVARQLLVNLANDGIATASEFLDTISPQYISDLISWGAVGARTTESQIHRELASGLSMPVGFKNGTDGNIQIAIDAIGAAAKPHHFLGVTQDGSAAIVSTIGNDTCHVILRGANTGPNYNEQAVANTLGLLNKKRANPRIMIDCSHGNSRKNHAKQALVANEVAKQVSNGNQNIIGVMIESHLQEGKQALINKADLAYGQSITDACVSWEQSIPMLDALANAVLQRRST